MGAARRWGMGDGAWRSNTLTPGVCAQRQCLEAVKEVLLKTKEGEIDGALQRLTPTQCGVLMK